MTTFAWEKLARLRADGFEDLLAQHWEEVALDQDRIPLAVDWPRYDTEERAGVLRIMAARERGRLVGYAAFFVATSMHYRTMLHAVNDVVYVDPEHRRGLLGARLVKASERALGEMAPIKVLYHTKLHVLIGKKQRPLGALLEALGYCKVEEVHSKFLEE